MADEARVDCAAEGPDVNGGVDGGARPDVEEFGGAVGQCAVLGGVVLDLEGVGAGGDADGGGEEAAEVHEDGGGARGRDHDVACFLC